MTISWVMSTVPSSEKPTVLRRITSAVVTTTAAINRTMPNQASHLVTAATHRLRVCMVPSSEDVAAGPAARARRGAYCSNVFTRRWASAYSAAGSWTPCFFSSAR